MSYNGIGLPSAKGSATSGHIQKSLVDSRRRSVKAIKDDKAGKRTSKYKDQKFPVKGSKSPKVTKDLEAHLDLRSIELQVAEYRDDLEENQEQTKITDEDIEVKCKILREKLIKEYSENQRISGLYVSRNSRFRADSNEGSVPERREHG